MARVELERNRVMTRDGEVRDICPSEHDIAQTIPKAIHADMLRKSDGEVFNGGRAREHARGLQGDQYSVAGAADVLSSDELPHDASRRGRGREFSVPVRIEMPKEAEYFRHGGILQHVLGQLPASAT